MSNYQVIFQDDSESLSHFGIKGMRWGVRRYQNPDGTRTPEGKARYNSAGGSYVDITKSSSGKISKRSRKRKSVEERRKEVLSDPKKLAKELYNPEYEFTQKELEDAIRVYNKENNLLRVAKERGDLTRSKKTQKKGENVVKKTINLYNDKLAGAVAAVAVAGTFKAMKWFVKEVKKGL